MSAFDSIIARYDLILLRIILTVSVARFSIRSVRSLIEMMSQIIIIDE